jgi:hypothetical protein
MENTLLKKIIQDLKGNEENGYLVPDLNKTMINVTKELNYAHNKKKKTSNKKTGKIDLKNSSRRY